MEISASDPRPSCRTVVVSSGLRETFARRLDDGESLRVRMISGTLWVTLEGDPEDHVLAGGEVRQFEGPGLCVAECIGELAEFEVG